MSGEGNSFIFVFVNGSVYKLLSLAALIMKHNHSLRDRWIQAGYDLFAAEGMEFVNIERLARITGLNKSGFYHHFSDRDGFLDELRQHHIGQAKLMAKDAATIHEIDPDLLQILIKWKTSVLAHQQLVKNRHHPRCLDCLNTINDFIDPLIIPHWARYIGLPDNPKLAYHYYDIVRDMFYARLTPDLFQMETLRTLVVEEAKGLLELLREGDRS
jgi:AcrR family transcriptional regulator